MATSTSAARFVSLDKKNLDKIVDEKDARSTKRVVGSSVNVLKEYCEAKEPQTPKKHLWRKLRILQPPELNSFIRIRTFYRER